MAEDFTSGLPVGDKEIARPRVDALLAQAVQKPLVVVHAGAGFGKTQAVARFLAASDYRTVWFSFSALDNIPSRFWENLITTFGLHRPALAEKMKPLGFPDTLQAFDAFLTELTAELYKDNKVVVFVFDDLHLITEPRVQGFLSNLISARLENNCILLITRQWPMPGGDFSLPTALIGPDELRFTVEETLALFAAAGARAEREEAEELNRYVSGWPIALSVVALALAREDLDHRDTAALSETKPRLFSLFEREIFTQYTPLEQSLLVKLSVLDSFPRGLVQAVSGERGRDLGQLLGGNIFIQYDAEAMRFYFHPLYQEFLRDKLRVMKKDEVDDAYRRAADWCRENGHYYDAVNYYRQCDDFVGLWQTLLRFEAVRRSKAEAEFFIEQLKTLPADFTDTHPMTQIVLAVSLTNNLQFEESLQVLDRVQARLEAVADGQDGESARLLGECWAARGIIALGRERLGFENSFREADALLPEGSSRWNQTLQLVDLGPALNLQSAKAGELKKSLAAFSEGVPHMVQVLHGAGQGMDRLCECEALFLTGKLKEAIEPAYQALYAARDASQYDIVGNALFMLLRIHTITGEYKQLKEIFAQVSEYEKNEETAGLGIWEIAKGWFHSEVDEVDKVAGWIRNAAASSLPPVSMDRALIVQMRCLIAAGREAEALALLEQFEARTREKEAVITLLYITLGRAVAHYYMGSYGPAIDSLKEAYNLARGNQLFTPFIEYGNRTRSLLERARDTKGHGIPAQWLEQTHAKASTFAKRHAYLAARYRQEQRGRPADFSLSKREVELLDNLGQGLTREEISESMQLSLNTVKSIIKQVFSKLGAVNSADAIRIAVVNKII